MLFLLPRIFRLRLVLLTAALVLVLGIKVFAQSSDARSPTSVRANEIVDSIAARDVGDSRLTDYFYTFTGLPGDLLITLESKNLNGDIDVFTAGELRPLLKITFYAESTTLSSKNIYLRKRESLILRIEARTPNDDPGTYRIRFSGSFEPIGGAALVADSGEPAEVNKDPGRSNDRKTTRVSSVGARIDEPVEEMAAAPTPKPTPKPTPVASPGPKPEKPVKTKPASEDAVRTVVGRRRPPRRNPTKAPTPTETARDKEKDSPKDIPDGKPGEAATNKPAETESSEASAATDKNGAESEKKTDSLESKPALTRRTGVRKTPARTATRKPTPQPENKARLVIEQRDGTKREFLMSNVRKVTVENGEIVVEVNDGYTQRISMTQVARMSIGP